MRQRLSWDKEKVAEISKKADPYTMNQDHANNPISKYETGSPDSWAETPDMKTPWKGEGRNEVGLPSPEAGRAAVQAARKLEDKALKCITIAQRMLPGGTDELIEKQATDLMYLPERSIISTLQRQAELAEALAAKSDDDEDEDEATASKKKEEYDEDEATASMKKDDEDEDEATASKKKEDDEDEATASKKDEDEDEATASKKKEDDEDEATASKKEKVPSEYPDEDKKPVEAKEEGEKKKVEDVEEGEEGEEGEGVNASIDLLDQIFAESTPKTGAKKLSGIVKQASSSNTSLDSLWSSPPDVSAAFR